MMSEKDIRIIINDNVKDDNEDDNDEGCDKQGPIKINDCNNAELVCSNSVN